MRNYFLPLFTKPCVIGPTYTKFSCFDSNVTVQVPGKLMKKLVEMCDGTRELKTIIESLEIEWDIQSLTNLFENLRLHQLLVDSRSVGEKMWEVVENPSIFQTDITNEQVSELVDKAKNRDRVESNSKIFRTTSSLLSSLLNGRKSVRNFSEKVIGQNELVNMLWSGYGETEKSSQFNEVSLYHRTVPSAGALYPLVMHLVLLKKLGKFFQVFTRLILVILIPLDLSYFQVI